METGLSVGVVRLVLAGGGKRVDRVGQVHEVAGHSEVMCARRDEREAQEHEGSDQ